MHKRTLSALLVSASLISTAAFANTFKIDAPIKSVVVYRDGGATVTRTGTVSLPPGRHTLSVERLSNDLDEEDFMASFNDAGIRLYALELESDYVDVPASKRQAELKQELDTLKDQDARLQARQQANELQLAFLTSLNQKSNGTDTSGLSFNQWDKALNFIGENGTSILQTNQDLAKERAALKDKRAALLRELAATGPSRQDFQTARLDIEVPSRKDVALDLSYFLEDANWVLDIDGALDTSAKKLTIRSTARITQETGEDWDNIVLALSNNRPTEDLGQIKQEPEILTLRDPSEEKLRNSVQYAPAPRREFDQSVEEIVVTGSVLVRTRSSAFDRLFEISAPMTIASDGRVEFVDLSQTTADASLVVRVNPSAYDPAYLFVDTELKEFESIRDISPSLRRDGHFVGSGQWPNLEADKPLKLPYGEDDAVSVTYIKQAPEDGDSGLFGRNNVKEERYLITVTNNHLEAMTVEVFDQVPVSGHEDIKVKVLSDATKPTETDMEGKQGLMMWRKTMAPGEVWQIKHQYRITYPSDMILSD